MTIRILRTKTPPPPPTHACELPDWWKRMRLGIQYGGRIQCDECHRVWEWCGPAMLSRTMGWRLVYGGINGRVISNPRGIRYNYNWP